MDGVSYTIACIFICNQVKYAVVSLYKSWTLDHIKDLEFMTVNNSDSTFAGVSGRILTSDPARPPFAPLSTKEPCLA